MKRANTIYLVDDNKDISNALEQLLQTMQYIIITCNSAQEFLDLKLIEPLACIILDVRMPGMSGMELQQRLIDKKCNLPIIFTTAFGDIDMATTAIKKGAVEFLTKPVNEQRLIDAINNALEKSENNYQQALNKNVLEVRKSTLTPREHDVLALLLDGKTTKDIAKQLTINVSTADLHRSHVIQKMGVKSTPELIKMILTSPEKI